MFSKIAVNNVKKSFKDYTIYFLTLTFAICIFYTFNSIDSQKAMLDMSSTQTLYVDMLVQVISMVSVFISFILAGLIVYATNFLIKKRKKEFGIYMSLGMSKRKISAILVIETLIIGVFSLLAGLILGIIVSQGLSLLTSKLFVIEMSKYSFIISKGAILKTILYFGIMYLVVMIFNTRAVSKYKLIDLLSASKKSENIKIRKPIIAFVTLIISVIIIGVAYYFVNKSNLDYTSNDFKIAIVLGVIGTFLFFYGISTAILSWMKKNNNIYLNKLNVFSIRQITSKFNTNSILMTVICLMLFFTMSILSVSLSMKSSMDKEIEKYTPFDATVLSSVDKNKNVEDQDVKEILKKYNFDLDENGDYIEYNYYEINVKPYDYLGKYAQGDAALVIENFGDSTEAIKLSDYNNIMKKLGKEQIELNDNQIGLVSTFSTTIDIVNSFLEQDGKVKIGNKEYEVKDKKAIEESFETSSSSISLFTLIIPDDMANGLKTKANYVSINFNNKNNSSKLEDLFDGMGEFKDNEANNYKIYGQTKEMVYSAYSGITSVMIYITVYLGIIFLIASATVLALQQLSECNESIERYKALKRIGATKKMINKSIFTQVSVFFGLPLALALAHSSVAIKVISDYINTFSTVNIIGVAFTMIAGILVVYGAYFYSTYVTYRNYINS